MEPLAITMGEPAGIGGEITAAAWSRLRATGPAFFLVDDPDRLARFGAPVEPIGTPAAANAVFQRALPVLPLTCRVSSALGEPNTATAPQVIRSIRTAVDLTKTGAASAVVTNPIHKAA
ncbi:MAG: 4-hydroxythreonine-4-phosphate dehydrogenase PdxA, partial [Pseudomonadota bacterium]